VDLEVLKSWCLQALKRSRGLSDEQIGRKLGVTGQMVFAYRSQKRRIPTDKAVKLGLVPA
jgi:transcriptional regulator with XRE-family HTH domain